MLVRMQKTQNFATLLVGMQNGIDILKKKCWAVSYNVKYILI